MKALIVYDSAYGNTEKIAKAIGSAVAGEMEVVRAGKADPGRLKGVDVLVVGSPVYGGRPTPATLEFLGRISESDIKDVKIAAFDTRLSSRFAKIFGYAAEKIADSLKAKGGVSIVSSEGFIVKGKKGPLKEGELERAAGWGNEIVKHL